MKTKEKLERAGWRYLFTFRQNREVYGRGDYRILYNPNGDIAYSYYIMPLIKREDIKPISEVLLEVFCERNEN